MRRVAVIGVGVTRFGKHELTSAELFAQAARDAIIDADISPSAIQALYYGNVTGGEGEHQLHLGPLAATLLGLPRSRPPGSRMPARRAMPPSAMPSWRSPAAARMSSWSAAASAFSMSRQRPRPNTSPTAPTPPSSSPPA